MQRRKLSFPLLSPRRNCACSLNPENEGELECPRLGETSLLRRSPYTDLSFTVPILIAVSHVGHQSVHPDLIIAHHLQMPCYQDGIGLMLPLPGPLRKLVTYHALRKPCPRRCRGDYLFLDYCSGKDRKQLS